MENLQVLSPSTEKRPVDQKGFAILPAGGLVAIGFMGTQATSLDTRTYFENREDNIDKQLQEIQPSPLSSDAFLHVSSVLSQVLSRIKHGKGREKEENPVLTAPKESITDSDGEAKNPRPSQNPIIIILLNEHSNKTTLVTYRYTKIRVLLNPHQRSFLLIL